MQGSDITYAMLITGRSSYLGDNALYYTSTNTYKLIDIYQATCKLIAKDAKLEMKGRRGKISEQPKFRTLNLLHGARIKPEIVEVEGLCNHLAKKVYEAKADGAIAVHNALTIYTSAFINFATGYRAVGDASFQSNEIDYQTGFAVITDKDSIDEYHSRLIWIMDECIKQIQAYQAQLKNVLSYSALNLPSIYKELSVELHGDHRAEKNLFPSLFLIENDKIIILTPSVYELNFPKSYPFPANAHRHFLRSNLLDKGCPSDVLNAFMGHWERGQEPWGEFSSLSAIEYKKTIRSILTELIVDQCGWKAINPYD